MSDNPKVCRCIDTSGGISSQRSDGRVGTVVSKSLTRHWAAFINREFNHLFPKNIQILAEPGRSIVAAAAYAVSKILGKGVRDGKLCYYINDGVYHTFSGVIVDHCHYHLRRSCVAKPQRNSATSR